MRALRILHQRNISIRIGRDLFWHGHYYCLNELNLGRLDLHSYFVSQAKQLSRCRAFLSVVHHHSNKPMLNYHSKFLDFTLASYNINIKWSRKFAEFCASH